MKTMLKHYFSHPSVWTYIFIAIGLLTFLITEKALCNYWWVIGLPIIIAPFFEWFAHKYILHAKIGNVKYLNKNECPEVKKNEIIKIGNENIPYRVISISNDKVKIGNGIAKKLPNWYLNFMEKLHYGHHKNPNNIPLVFAPIMSVLILFAAMFLLFLAISWNLNMSLTFLFAVVCYYLHYEWMHLGHHISDYNHIMPWSKTLKKVHLFHHFKNENYWWGITNILGDIILGTYKKHNEVVRSKTTNDINP
jgi:hypothetical protein